MRTYRYETLLTILVVLLMGFSYGCTPTTPDDPSPEETPAPAVEEPSTDPVVDPVVEPIVEPVTDPVPEPVIEPTPDPVADVLWEPTGAFWPCFHGPNGDNKSTETGLLSEWPEGGPELLWQVDGFGHGYSGVSTADGRIFLTGNEGEDDATQEIVYCLDMDGNTIWTVPNGSGWAGSYEGTRSTPTIDGDRVYAYSPTGRICCLNVEDGEEIWNANVLELYEGVPPTWAQAESVKLDGDRVVCSPCGAKASVVALDKMTGEEVWTTPGVGGAKPGYCTPTICEWEGLRIVLTMSGAELIGANADTGELLFTHPHPTKHDINATDPIFHEGRIFITSGYGTTGSEAFDLTVDGDQASVEIAWTNPDFDNQHGGVILYEGYLYGSAHSAGRSSWFCVDWETGETQWVERGVGMGSLTYADGMLYLMGETNKFGLIRATPEAYELTGEFSIPREGKGKTWAHPVVVDGKLYIRHGEFLYCHNVSAE